MLVDAITLVQDVQLVCFCLIFAFFAFQHWDDRARRWLWYNFLANGAAALLDFTRPYLPSWLGLGVNALMVPLSYVFINIAILRFLKRRGSAPWIAWCILALAAGPAIWFSTQRNAVGTFAMQDFAIFLECLLATTLLLTPGERSTRVPRHLMGWFLLIFSGLEISRVAVTVVAGGDPGVFSTALDRISAIGYVVNTSLLPLGFVWMINTRLEADLRMQAVMDPLTQVLNRRGLRSELERELARSRRNRAPLTIAVADIDHFKQWNDQYGHASGDTVLTSVAALLRSLLRATDVLARVGGEEFVLLLPGTGAEEARLLLERLCSRIGQMHTGATPSAETLPARITMSFGASVSGPEQSAGDLLHFADVALYRAKHDGRDCVRIYEPRPALESWYPKEEARAHRWNGLTGAADTLTADPLRPAVSGEDA